MASPLRERPSWPACAKTALIFSKTMPKEFNNQWKLFQKLAAELLFQWMEITRDTELYEQLPAQNPDIARPDHEPASGAVEGHLRQSSFSGFADFIPLKWKAPSTRTEFNR